MIHPRLHIFAFLLLAWPAQALDVLVDQSVLRFTVYLGADDISGRLTDWSASVDFDANKIHVAVELTSATTDDPLLDVVLHSRQWLDSVAYPRAVFTSDDIDVLAAGLYQAKGTLNIKGRTVPLVVLIHSPAASTRGHHAIQAIFDRRDADMSALADTVAPAIAISGNIRIQNQ